MLHAKLYLHGWICSKTACKAQAFMMRIIVCIRVYIEYFSCQSCSRTQRMNSFDATEVGPAFSNITAPFVTLKHSYYQYCSHCHFIFKEAMLCSPSVSVPSRQICFLKFAEPKELPDTWELCQQELYPETAINDGDGFSFQSSDAQWTRADNCTREFGHFLNVPTKKRTRGRSSRSYGQTSACHTRRCNELNHALFVCCDSFTLLLTLVMPFCNVDIVM